MKLKTLGFIGGGRITKIMLQAFKNKDLRFEKIVVSDTNRNVLDSLKLQFPEIMIISENGKEVVQNDILFVALHPPVLMETLKNISGFLKHDTILVSLAPKITMDKIAEASGGLKNIVRMNPSASSIINKGVNPMVFSSGMQENQKYEFMDIIASLGSVPVVEESKIEAYAVIIAMGHTYYFFQFQKLLEQALLFGMNVKEAKTAISEMVSGTAETLFHSGLNYQEVNDLIPVKPMLEAEEAIKGIYDQYLTGIYNKIKP